VLLLILLLTLLRLLVLTSLLCRRATTARSGDRADDEAWSLDWFAKHHGMVEVEATLPGGKRQAFALGRYVNAVRRWGPGWAGAAPPGEENDALCGADASKKGRRELPYLRGWFYAQELPDLLDDLWASVGEQVRTMLSLLPLWLLLRLVLLLLSREICRLLLARTDTCGPPRGEQRRRVGRRPPPRHSARLAGTSGRSLTASSGCRRGIVPSCSGCFWAARGRWYDA